MQPEQPSPSDSGDHQPLGSAEYRARLMTKLNCLMAVLEVAISKIAKNMDLPGANEERLTKIRSNLENTLSICERAKSTLERSPARNARSRQLPAITATSIDKMSARDYVELSSIEEYRKFKQLPPIQTDELVALDIEELVKKFN